MQLKGKNAIVTGASRGIGAAVAENLASKGVNVAVVYAGSAERAQAVCDKLVADYGVKAVAYQCDVSDFDAAKTLASTVAKEFGSIEILVNNAGITRDGLMMAMREDAFDAVIDTNLKGVFNMTRHCARYFVKGRCGRIINMTSVSGIMGNAGQTNYSASKAGVIGLTKATARELAAKGITCNAVAPGFVDTDMTKDFDQEDEKIKGMIPLGRFAQPEEVAEAVAFLAGADYITGEVLRVDGGVAI